MMQSSCFTDNVRCKSLLDGITDLKEMQKDIDDQVITYKGVTMNCNCIQHNGQSLSENPDCCICLTGHFDH